MPQTLDHFAGRGYGRALAPALILLLLVGCATDRGVQQTLSKVTLDNEEVRVVETTYPKGGSLPMHTHLWPRVVYVVEGGKLQTTAANGSVSAVELHPGQTLWRNVESHSVLNVGETPVRIVEVEVKNAATERSVETFPLPEGR